MPLHNNSSLIQPIFSIWHKYSQHTEPGYQTRANAKFFIIQRRERRYLASGEDKAFTAKLPVDIETAKKKNVQFAFTPGNNFQEGNYTIQIYQNGFLIGEVARELKKGGLFS